jgi:hypothetical protein
MLIIFTPNASRLAPDGIWVVAGRNDTGTVEGGGWAVNNVDTTPRTYAVEGNIKKKDLTPYRSDLKGR